jgi:hypothetical protein
MRFRVTVRSEHDEVVEFESEQPVVHIDMPAGRFVITVRRAPDDADTALSLEPKGGLH